MRIRMKEQIMKLSVVVDVQTSSAMSGRKGKCV